LQKIDTPFSYLFAFSKTIAKTPHYEFRAGNSAKLYSTKRPPINTKSLQSS